MALRLYDLWVSLKLRDIPPTHGHSWMEKYHDEAAHFGFCNLFIVGVFQVLTFFWSLGLWEPLRMRRSDMCLGNPIRAIPLVLETPRCRCTRPSSQEVQALRDELVASQNNLSADHTKQRLAFKCQVALWKTTGPIGQHPPWSTKNGFWSRCGCVSKLFCPYRKRSHVFHPRFNENDGPLQPWPKLG